MINKVNIGVIKKDGKYALVSTISKHFIKASNYEELEINIEGLDYIDSSEIGNMIKKYSKIKSK